MKKKDILDKILDKLHKKALEISEVEEIDDVVFCETCGVAIRKGFSYYVEKDMKKEETKKELLEKIKDTIGIKINTTSEETIFEKVFDDGGLRDFVDTKEYINKVDLVKWINKNL